MSLKLSALSRTALLLAFLMASVVVTSGCNGSVPYAASTSPGLAVGIDMDSFADVVRKVVPSVVYVYSEIPSANGQDTVLSAGSGVILRSDGYILTNKHVVANATRSDVTLENRTTYPVTGTWLDDNMDLAVVKIDAKDLIAMRFADPEKISMGDWVIALGHAMGLSPLEGGLSVTSGVVSNLGRSFVVSGIQHYDVVQTDAAINPGNSGGPLVNLNGELVGINTAGATEVQNIGFAINVGVARHAFEDLVKYGKSHHPYLGVVVADITQDVARTLECLCNDGALVTQVEAYGPCASAGIQKDDMIASIDGDSVHSAAEFIKYLWRHEVGDEVEVVYHRAGVEKKVTITLGERGKGQAAFVGLRSSRPSSSS